MTCMSPLEVVKVFLVPHVPVHWVVRVFITGPLGVSSDLSENHASCGVVGCL